MIEVDGKYYFIDMDKVMSWVSETPNSERNISTMTTLSYPIVGNDESEITTSVVEKEVSESKNSLNETFNNMRYDFLRILLNTILTPYTDAMGKIYPMRFEDLTLGQRLAFNTLIKRDIIREVTN